MDTQTVERPADGARSADRGTPPAEVKTINLALQGGGAHGAFAWGVLDRLLEDERIAFEGVTRDQRRGDERGRAGLRPGRGRARGCPRRRSPASGGGSATPRRWARCSPRCSTGCSHNHSLDYSPAFLMLDLMSRLLSPYQLNPANYNPLRHVLEQSVDFERLRARCPVKLFLSATNVRTGKIKLFEQRTRSPSTR